MLRRFALTALTLAGFALGQVPSVAAPVSGTGATPALWEVAPKDGQKGKLYLFGTFHALPKELRWRTPVLDAALRRSARLVTEVVLSDAAKPDVARDVASVIQTQGFTTPDKAAIRQMTAAQIARLEAAAAAQGLPKELVPRMKPWFAVLLVTQSLVKDAGFDPDLGADQQVRRWIGGKPNLGLETLQQQMSVFASLDDAAAAEALAETFSSTGSDAAALRTLAAVWARGSAADLKREFYDETRSKYPAFFEALLMRRNQAWIEPLEHYLAQPGRTFVAVGAGHLVGDGSVIALLQARGYKIRKVQ